MPRWSLSLALAVVAPAWSTSVEPMPLDALLANTDHVLLATVSAVDMVDAQGKPVTDPQARTGPGGPNLIRYLQVDRVATPTSAKVHRRLRARAGTAGTASTVRLLSTIATMMANSSCCACSALISPAAAA